MTSTSLFIEKRNIILEELKLSLESINPESVETYIEMIEKADKVFLVGVGRVLLSLKAICKRYAHLGIETYIVGDITEPAITKRSLLIVGSSSGETIFPVEIAKKAKQLGAAVIHVGSNPEGSVSKYTDFFIRIPVATMLQRTDELKSSQPMTSLFEQSLLLLGDITAMMILERKGTLLGDLWQYHANLE